MGENLVIVESPAKAKTIEKFLGSAFIVKSSFGHIRDLSKKNLGIDIENGFEPDYLISEDKTKVVSELKSLAKKSKIVWLASDEDREGEAIAWHLQEALELDKSKTKRIVFHEITKEAITNAINNPREVNFNLVMAQQARRVLDRLVGFELSPILWKKVRPKLSAGRVQSVALRLIVEREREIQNFEAKSNYKIEGTFHPEQSEQNSILKAEISHRFNSSKEALNILEQCRTGKFVVTSTEKKEHSKSPAAPFTTSTLQQEASRKLGFSLSQTMRVAQNLYEAGLITYMRTDSVNLSKVALNSSKKVIDNLFGPEYSKTRQYSTKSKGAQEAHEAIRPTYIENRDIEAGAQEKKLYSLIWKRTVASQMSDAILEKTQINIQTKEIEYPFVATADIITFDGFLKLYIESKDDENSEENLPMLLPNLVSGTSMDVIEILATEKFTQKPPRYTEASLVKKLEELGIGRPSTYAPTISTLGQRGYIIKESREGNERSYHQYRLYDGDIKDTIKKEIWGTEKNKLFPEDIGILVTDFLVEHFRSIIDYNFTAKIEEDFDKVATGKLVWNKLISEFYTPFHSIVEDTLATSKPTNAERLLGVDPKTGKNVYSRLGRFGPLVQIGEADDPDKKFMSLGKGQLIETITIDQALKLFELPRVVGEYNNQEIICAIGRFGPYIKYEGSFISLGKDNNPYDIDIDKCIEIIDNHKIKEAQKHIKSFPEQDIQLLNGRFGPYIKRGKDNFKIPKNIEPTSLELEDILKIIDSAGSTKKSTVSKKGSATKKSTPGKKSTPTKKSTPKSKTAKSK